MTDNDWKHDRIILLRMQYTYAVRKLADVNDEINDIRAELLSLGAQP
jgi:hypothetical protein